MTRLSDPVSEAKWLVDEAAQRGIQARLLGGVAVQILCPDFSILRGDGTQDLDVAVASASGAPLTDLLEELGYVPDRRFNALYGHKQLYFSSGLTGRSLDVLIDRLEMCHTLDFSKRLGVMQYTLDPCDLLLTKLQIVEINRKDLEDIIYLLCAVRLADGSEQPGTIALQRFTGIVGTDWGWWRTATLNLDRVVNYLQSSTTFIPPTGPKDPLHQVRLLISAAQQCKKSLRWRARARIGDRVRWYSLPEETPHDPTVVQGRVR
jgi:hypothetical protein